MSPVLTRRGLVQAGAAAIGATVAGIPASARAAPDPDAGLFVLITQYREVAVERSAHAPVHEAAEERFKAAAPTRPEALTETFSDFLNGITGSGREQRSDGRVRGFFIPGDVERLRAAGSVMELTWDDEGQPLPPMSNPCGEKRRQEILAVYDAWEAEKQAVSDQVGLTAAAAEDDRLYEVVWSLRHEIRATQPATLVGLCAKARWVLTLADFEDDDEQVVRDLAAFGARRRHEGP